MPTIDPATAEEVDDVEEANADEEASENAGDDTEEAVAGPDAGAGSR